MKSVVQRVAAIVAGLLIAVILAEVALRSIGFEFHLYPAKVQFGWPDPVEIKRLYKPDRDLLWVPKNYPEEGHFPADFRPSLVFMGCSCTEFGGYDRFLAEIVRGQYPDSTFTSVNLGVGGWSSYQGLQQLKRDVAPMSPRIITIYYGWNDHWCTFGLEDKQIGDFYREHSAGTTALSESSRLMQLIDKYVFSSSVPAQTSSQRVSLDDFRSNLKEMVRIAREHSIIPVLLTAPSSHQRGREPVYLKERWLKDLSDLIPLHESYVKAVRDTAHEDKVHLVDLYDLFRRLPTEEQAASFVEDGIHLTEQGSRRIARHLYEYFVETGLIRELLN